MNNDSSDITRQVTNTVYHNMMLSPGFVQAVREAKDEHEIARLIDEYMELITVSPVHFKMVTEFISICKLYINWDIVIKRLRGQEWSW